MQVMVSVDKAAIKTGLDKAVPLALDFVAQPPPMAYRHSHGKARPDRRISPRPVIACARLAVDQVQVQSHLEAGMIVGQRDRRRRCSLSDHQRNAIQSAMQMCIEHGLIAGIGRAEVVGDKTYVARGPGISHWVGP